MAVTYSLPTHTPSFSSHQHTTMPSLSTLFSRSKSKRKQENEAAMKGQTRITPAPMTRTTPTRRPASDLPPAYTEAAPTQIASTTNASSATPTADSPFSFLAQFDTIFLIDDSGSMSGSNWRETTAALSAITPICTQWDADGIDIYFLNHRNPNDRDLGGYHDVTDCAGVDEIFRTVRPLGGTPTGTRLRNILKPYITKLEQAKAARNATAIAGMKPLNIIVITDGAPHDDVEATVVWAAKKLDAVDADPEQVGIQFFQVGRETEAAEALEDLDDALSGRHGIRDIVDTVPWTKNGQTLSADGILKVVLGAVNKRLDRRRASDERLRS